MRKKTLNTKNNCAMVTITVMIAKTVRKLDKTHIFKNRHVTVSAIGTEDLL